MHALLVLVFLLNTSVSPSYDITPPTLVSFTITPQGLPFTDDRLSDSGNYCCIDFTATIQEDESGLHYAKFWFFSDRAPSQNLVLTYWGSAATGEPDTGVFEKRFLFDPLQRADGRWHLEIIQIYDGVGNRTHINALTTSHPHIDTSFILNAQNLYVPLISSE